MDSFRNNYGEFMDDLIPFVDSVSQRYKKGAPSALQYVKLIPIILKTNDRDLQAWRIKQVIEKFKIVRGVTLHVFKYLHLYVQDEFKEWVQSQMKKLTWWLELSETSLSEAIMRNDKPAVEGKTLNRCCDGTFTKTLLLLNFECEGIVAA